MTVKRLLLALAVGLVLLVGCGSSAPPGFTSHGTLDVSTGLFSGGSPSDLFPTISDGVQVTVVNSSNTVIGTGTLHQVSSPAETVGQTDSYTFTVANLPGGLTRYGFEIGGKGTVWDTPSEAKHPAFSLSAN